MRNIKAESPKESEKAKPVGIWIRVSTEDQARGESPEHHEKRARYYAESKGWEVREVYHLEAVSGKSVKEHPETQRMLNDVKDGRISGIIFSKLARLARNTRELLDFADTFRELNADLISLQESIDTSTPAGRLFYTIIAAMAQWEREEIAERVAASVPIRAKLGKPLGGAAPFGYQWENKVLAPNPQEAPILRLMFELFSKHKGIRTVAKLLNETGHRTRKGSKFSGTTVRRLLADPVAKGLRRMNYTKSPDAAKRWMLKPEREWVWQKVEPAISEELWEECNRVFDKRRNGRRPSEKRLNPFTGFVFCICGNKMYVPVKSPKYVCYRCHNKIPVEDLEAVFHEQLKNFCLSPSEMAKCVEEADETLKKSQGLLKSLEEEQTRVSHEMDKVYRLYIEEKVSSNGFAERYGPLERRKKQLDDQIPQLLGEIDFLKIKNLSTDEILAEAQDLYSRWTLLDPEEKRNIIENITEKVAVGKDEVTIDLCYFPTSLQNLAKTDRTLRDSWPRPA